MSTDYEVRVVPQPHSVSFRLNDSHRCFVSRRWLIDEGGARDGTDAELMAAFERNKPQLRKLAAAQLAAQKLRPHEVVYVD